MAEQAHLTNLRAEIKNNFCSTGELYKRGSETPEIRSKPWVEIVGGRLTFNTRQVIEKKYVRAEKSKTDAFLFRATPICTYKRSSGV